MLTAALAGLVVDSTLVGLGRLAFPSGVVVSWLCPPWIVVMWMQFATTLRFSLRWLLPRPLVAAGFGAVGGPLAYTIGERLGAVSLRPPLPVTLISLGLFWMLAVPFLAWRATRTDGAGYRLRTADEDQR